MERFELLSGLRTALILTNSFGIVFAFVALILSFHPTSLVLLLFLALSSSMSLWVRVKAAKSQRIQLPTFPTETASSISTLLPRHGLIACADLISGTLLLVLHIISMITSNHNGIFVVALYAIFAALLASFFHYALFGLHLVAWRQEVKRNQPRCQLCQQRVNHGVVTGPGNGPVEEAGGTKFSAEEEARRPL